MDGNTVMISGLVRAVPATAAGTRTHAELVVLLRPTVVGAGVFKSVVGSR